jgi:hypothetical protein
MTKREAMELTHQENRLMALGISRDDANALRRISMTLRRWFEHECNGVIQRDGDEPDSTPYYFNPDTGRKGGRVADRETGARKRLTAIMAKYPTLTAYVQGDPRGCSLYILTAEHLAGEHPIDSVYTRGVAIA